MLLSIQQKLQGFENQKLSAEIQETVRMFNMPTN